MTIRIRILALLAGVGALSLVASASAQAPSAPTAGAHTPDQTNEGAKVTGDTATTTADQLLLAQQLFQYAQQNKDVVAMVAAARIAKAATPSSSGGIPKDAAPGPGVTTAAAKSGDAIKPMDADGMLAAARLAAGSDPALLALVNQAASTASKGFNPGLDDNDILAGGWIQTWHPGNAAAGRLAYVAISGDGSSDLDLQVKDEYGHVVCESDGPYDDENCSWTPAWTGPFTIVVTNRGRQANWYDIWTN